MLQDYFPTQGYDQILNREHNYLGGALVISTYAIFYFDIVQGKDEWIGFLVNQSVQNTEDIKNLYYKCSIINQNPDSQINLRNFRFQVIDPTHILLVGIGAYLLKLSLKKKDNIVQSMELIKIPELNLNRISFIAAFPKSQRENSYIFFLGSYMTNSQLYEFELHPEPIVELQVHVLSFYLLNTRPQKNNTSLKTYKKILQL